MRNPRPVTRISFSLALLTISLVMMAFSLGLLPDENKSELDKRGKLAEALSIQLVHSIEQNDQVTIKRTIDAVVARNTDILSVAIRLQNGDMLVGAGDHEKNWISNKSGKSNATHVQVPVENADSIWGSIEIVFEKLNTQSFFFGLPNNLVYFLGFMGLFGFALNLWAIGKSLKVLDPSKVVPERVQKAFDTLNEGAIILDGNTNILMANSNFCEMFGQNAEDLLGKSIATLKFEDEEHDEPEVSGTMPPWQLAFSKQEAITGIMMKFNRATGDVVRLSVNATPVMDDKGRVQGVVTTFDNVTDVQIANARLSSMVTTLTKQEEALTEKNVELQRLATRDPMTDCYNRRAFFEKFEHLIEVSKASQTPLFCMMSDLDHFKSVNDIYGHGVGDEVIVLMGNTLKDVCDEHGFVGRYGGEEFCVILSGIDKNTCLELAETVRRTILARSETISVLQRTITTSIGVVEITNEELDANAWVSRADKALYAAKTAGRNRVVDWNFMPELLVSEEEMIEQELKLAVSNGELLLKFQPIIDPSTREVHSMEALFRCTRETLQSVSVEKLITVAEKNALIFTIGDWVFENAVAIYKNWILQGITVPGLAINLSSVQLQHAESVVKLADFTRDAQASGIDIQFEITETSAVEDWLLVSQNMETLKKAGAGIALDDFGTGHSGYKYISSLNPDIIKIDKACVQGMSEGKVEKNLVRSISALAQDLGVKCVAEGVETNEQLEELVNIGCDLVQGYLISIPMDEREAGRWLQIFGKQSVSQSLEQDKLQA